MIGRQANAVSGTYTIGEAAERLGVSVHTLRYYEAAGLLGLVRRNSSGHRAYTEADLHYLDLLRCLRRSGLPIADVKRFAEMVRRGETSIPDRIVLLDRHRRAIDAQRKILDHAATLVDEKLARYVEMAR